MVGGRVCEPSALGPAPLIRHTHKGDQLLVQPEGIELLRKAGGPIYVAFAIGGSRCGKSTLSNSLTFGKELGSAGFETGSSFDPVTEGVDIAVRLLPGGGALILGDCEGAFHIAGSNQSSRGFGSLGILAYYLSSTLIHVSMGSVDERDIEALGYLAARACDGSITSAKLAPTLVLLVNGSRFDLGEAVARRLLRPPDSGNTETARWCARGAISHSFRGTPAVEALPACEHAAYWPKVDDLRKRLLEVTPVAFEEGKHASGAEVAEHVGRIVNALNGEAPALAILREPQPSTEALYRTVHLEPIVEDISHRFAAAGASGEVHASGSKLMSPDNRALEEALAEFDKRTAAITMAGANADGTPATAPFPGDLVADMRSRLNARLSGINEALARGRSQGTHRRPRLSRPHLGVDTSRGDPQLDKGKENVTPITPSTPNKKSLSALEVDMAEISRRTSNQADEVESHMSELQDLFGNMNAQLHMLREKFQEEERQNKAGAIALQDKWHDRLLCAADDRVQAAREQDAAAERTMSELKTELHTIQARLLDAESCAIQLDQFRDNLEAQRLGRREAGEAATLHVDESIKLLRAGVDEERFALGEMRETIGRRFVEYVEDMRVSLEEERQLRSDKHRALASVVAQLQSTLEGGASPRRSRSNFSSPAPRRIADGLDWS